VTPITNYQPWIFAFNVFQFLLSSGLGIYVWYSNKEKVTNKRFEAQDQRITKIETEVQHPPSCTRHQTLEDKLTDLNKASNHRLDALHGDIRELTGSMKGLNRAVDLMNEYLIKRER
jgi:hypothetical protein